MFARGARVAHRCAARATVGTRSVAGELTAVAGGAGGGGSRNSASGGLSTVRHLTVEAGLAPAAAAVAQDEAHVVAVTSQERHAADALTDCIEQIKRSSGASGTPSLCVVYARNDVASGTKTRLEEIVPTEWPTMGCSVPASNSGSPDQGPSVTVCAAYLPQLAPTEIVELSHTSVPPFQQLPTLLSKDCAPYLLVLTRGQDAQPLCRQLRNSFGNGQVAAGIGSSLRSLLFSNRCSLPAKSRTVCAVVPVAASAMRSSAVSTGITRSLLGNVHFPSGVDVGPELWKQLYFDHAGQLPRRSPLDLRLPVAGEKRPVLLADSRMPLYPGRLIEVPIRSPRDFLMFREHVRNGQLIGVVTSDCEVGTMAHLIDMLPDNDHTFTALVRGGMRFHVQDMTTPANSFGLLSATAVPFTDTVNLDECMPLVTEIHSVLLGVGGAHDRLRQSLEFPEELEWDPRALSWRLAAILPVTTLERNSYLTMTSTSERLAKQLSFLKGKLRSFATHPGGSSTKRWADARTKEW